MSVHRRGWARRIRPGSHDGSCLRGSAALGARAAIVVAAIAAVLGFSSSASAQRGTIAVTAVVAPASTIVPQPARAFGELPEAIHRTITRDVEGTLEVPRARREGDRGASSWITTVRSAPVAA